MRTSMISCKNLKYYNTLMMKDPSYCYKFYWLEAISASFLKIEQRRHTMRSLMK